MHNPNPFDFVPFADAPTLRTREHFDNLGGQWSGYLEIKLAALTPVHVVGSLSQGRASGNSKMVRQDERACIPAATLRGCLRAFVEALTSGWVSQATPEYAKEFNKRHIGFSTFETYQNDGRNNRRRSPPAVNPAFRPAYSDDEQMDVASYLFGIVTEAAKGQDEAEAVLTRKGRVWLEDAFIAGEHLKDNKYWIPDIAGDAFMGGAKPSASNWWYLKPDDIWRRQTHGHQLAEFVGAEFWGRKFYYHQNPTRCVAYYDIDGGEWHYAPGRGFRKVMLECMEANTTSDAFRLYVDRLPTPLLHLLVLALIPGRNMRHKLGYGKAYGYGSIEFSIVGVKLRNEEGDSRVPGPLVDESAMVDGWVADAFDEGKLVEAQVADLIDKKALNWLARILGRQGSENLLFTYPPFATGDFMQPVQLSALNAAAPSVGGTSNVSTMGIAKALFPLKRPIHFRYYQQAAQGWAIIKRRTP